MLSPQASPNRLQRCTRAVTNRWLLAGWQTSWSHFGSASRAATVLLAAAVCLNGVRVHAAPITKADNTIDLATGPSWTTGTPPTNVDTAVWDSTVMTANTSSLGTTAAWLGIQILNPGGAVGISLVTGRTLTLSTGGIDMSAANQDLTIGGGNLRLATSATEAFNVATGRTLTVNSTMSTQGGTTTLNISGAGATNLNGAITNSVSPLNINNTGAGVLTLGGTITDAITSLNATATGARVVVNGATVNVGSLSTYGTSTLASSFELQTGAANFNGGIRTSTADASLIKVSGGAFTASSVQLQRTQSFTTLPAAASTTSGFIVAGGTASVTGTLDISTNISSASALVSGGALTVGGQTTIAAGSTTRFSFLQVSGGSFTSTDTTGGIVLGAYTGTGNAPNAELLLTGGTTTAERIGFGVTGSLTGTTGTLVVNGAAASLYVGSGGIVQVPTTGYTSTINLTSGIIGAKADWSSSLGMTLNGTSFTVQAADASTVAHNITLSGQIGGAGGLIKTGAGTLTLTGGNFYTGITTINAGMLNINGINALGGSVYTGTTFNGGTLQYAATLTSSGDITVAAGGTTAIPVTFSASGATIDTNGNSITYTNTVGNSGTGGLTKTGTGTLTLNAASTFTGVTTISNGTLATNLGTTATLGRGDVTIANTTGAVLTLGSTVSVADSAILRFGTNSVINMNSGGTDVLAGIIDTSTGASIPEGTYTAAQLNSFFSNGGASPTFSFIEGAAGSAFMVAVPEPSTWAMMLGGAGLMALRIRSRNKRQRAS
jgi:autotransporter-associated beta strand protein